LQLRDSTITSVNNAFQKLPQITLLQKCVSTMVPVHTVSTMSSNKNVASWSCLVPSKNAKHIATDGPIMCSMLTLRREQGIINTKAITTECEERSNRTRN